ncbi:hypothetical protein CE91St64_36720 [Faecalicatena contorta]|nr:hypothetical protein CE91St64_36720 [Faecalicatena contorta]
MKQAIWQYRNLYKNLLSLVDGRGTLYDREDGEVLGLPSLKLIHQLPIPTFSFAFFLAIYQYRILWKFYF